MIFNMTDEEWEIVIKVHLYGTFYCTRSACKLFKQQRSGRIINTSSIAGLGNMGQANYSAAKEGIIGFTRTVARDMGKYGVTCNAIRPLAATRLSLSPELKAAWAKRGMQEFITSVEAATPDMIAPFVVFLCTDHAANVNGYDFNVGDGMIGVFSQPVIMANIDKKGKIWSVDELIKFLPTKVTGNLQNLAL
jgi:NAD(P)-dependent dehydrogenase (short-subunit alcohol dehydrogenase family)